MQAKEQDIKLQEIFQKYCENSQITLEQTLKAFDELAYKPAKKDSQLIFETLKSKNTNYLTFEQFEFWWTQLKSVGTQDFLVKSYVKLFKASKTISEKLSKETPEKILIDKNFQGSLIRLGFGKIEETDQNKLTQLRIHFKNGLNAQKQNKEKQSIRQLLQIPQENIQFALKIKLSENIDSEQCAKDLQALMKSIIIVGTSLHKGTKQILSKINFSTKIIDGNAYIIAGLEKNVQTMIQNIIYAVQEYLEKIQPEEEFELNIRKLNDLAEIFEAVKSNNPKTALPLLFNNSEISISTLACRFFNLIAKCKELEKLDSQKFQLIFAFLTLIKSLKIDMQFKNLDQNDKWLEQYDWILPHLDDQKLPLPNMNIIKKLKDFSFNYLESFFKIYFVGPNLKLKMNFNLPKLSEVLKQFLQL